MPTIAYQDLFERIDEAEVTRICRELVRFQTVNPPGQEQTAAEYVARLLSQAGFESGLVPLAEGRASTLGHLRGSGGCPGLLFNGHLDVVPVGVEGWTYPPFEAEVADGKIWGRGAADMKGGLAALLMAARAVATTCAATHTPLRGDLIVAATADEESGMRGARSITDSLAPIQAIIVAEPTANTLGLAERGVLWLELTTHGKTAHGSMPELGRNAILMMTALLAGLQELSIPFTHHPVLGDFSRSINTIAGGVKTNVVPDRCVVTVDMRTVPGQDHAAIVEQVNGLIARLQARSEGFSAGLQVLYDLPAVTTDPQADAVRRFAEAALAATGRPLETCSVRFATEASIYVPALGVPAIIYGPGDPALAHQPDEHVPIAQLVEAARVYALAALELLA
jgi:succinyl-diaminopimelate desuccinylase